MSLKVRWRGTGLPPGNSSPSGAFFAGDAGVGDTPGPHIVESENNLQSRPFITGSPFGTGMAMELHHYAATNATPMWVAWHLEMDSSYQPVAFDNGWHVRLYMRSYAPAYTTAPPLYVYGYGPDGAGENPNSNLKWAVEMKPDQRVLDLAGGYWWENGRRWRVIDGATYASTQGYGAHQTGGNGRWGVYEWKFRMEVRCSPTGWLEMAIFEDWVDPDVPRQVLSQQLTNWDMDTLCIHARTSLSTWRPDMTYDNIEVWDDYDSQSWKGAYVPHGAYFQEVTAAGVGTDVTVEGELTSRNPDVVTPLPNWHFDEEYQSPDFEYIESITRDDMGEGGYYQGQWLGAAFIPNEDKFPGPHPWITWAHSGFFQRGTPYSIPWDWVAALTDRGIAVFTLRYPLAPRPSLLPNDYNGKVKHPLQVIAYKSQWAYIKKRAAYWNLDPALGMMSGYSAGGNLAFAAALSRNVTNFNGYNMMYAWGGAQDPDPLGVFAYAAPVNWQRLVAEDSTAFIAADTARAYMGGHYGSPSYIADPASIHLLPALSAASIPNLKVGYVLGSQDPLIGPGNQTDLGDAMTAAGLGANYESHLIVADHDNIDTVNDPVDPVNGIVPWVEDVLGVNMPQEVP